MAATTGINWADHTASPWYGCQHATLPDGSTHPGCDHCYAETMAKRNPATLGVWGADGTRVVSKSFHENCRRWNKLACQARERRRVFPSICDPFEEWDGPMLSGRVDDDGTPFKLWHFEGAHEQRRLSANVGGQEPVTMDDCRRDLFATIDACPWLDFLLLTKRPQNVRRMWPMTRCPFCDSQPCAHLDECGSMTAVQHWEHIHATGRSSNYRGNVWLLTSVSDQATADAMVPELLNCRRLVPVLGVSAEPLLGPIHFGDVEVGTAKGGYPMLPFLSWIIIGVESRGKSVGRVGCENAWWDMAARIVDQAKSANVPVWFKQGPKQGRVTDDLNDFPGPLALRELPAK